MRYCLLIVSHNFSFNSVQHIVNISKKVFKDSSLSSQLSQSRTKCKPIVKQVLSGVVSDNLKKDLNNVHFSVLLDESTDISNNRLLCILVRFVKKDVLTTARLDTVRIGSDERTAKGLFTLFEDTLKKIQLDVENIVGYSSDNASVMMGNKESFKTNLMN